MYDIAARAVDQPHGLVQVGGAVAQVAADQQISRIHKFERIIAPNIFKFILN